MKTKSRNTLMKEKFIPEFSKIVNEETINPAKLEGFFSQDFRLDLRKLFSDIESEPSKHEDIYLSFESIFSINTSSNPNLKYIKSLIRLSLSDDDYEYTRKDALKDCKEAALANHPGAKFLYGVCLYFGDTVKKDKIKGLNEIKEASKAGSLQADIFLENLAYENRAPSPSSKPIAQKPRANLKRKYDTIAQEIVVESRKWILIEFDRRTNECSNKVVGKF